MELIKDGAVVNPDWNFIDDLELADTNINQILPVEAFLANPEQLPVHSEAQIAGGQGLVGVRIGADSDLEALSPHFDQLALIVIEFSSFADGRGFSIAHRLRNTFNYAGEIWGSGIIADQYAFAIQCGIDAVLVDEKLLQRQPVEDWRQALASAPAPYSFKADLKKTSKIYSKISKRIAGSQFVTGLNSRFSAIPTEKLLEFALNDESIGRTAILSSFGAESAVLLHLISNISPDAPILFLDTAKHFPETLGYQKELAARLKLTNIKILRPELAAIAGSDPQGTLWQQNSTACCDLRKVVPLEKALASYDSWISGRKSYQDGLRKPLQLFELSGKHIKINPLANWSHDGLLEHMRKHNLPAHPLVSQGYSSIGCAPCTSPVCHGENTRAGRWRGLDKTECGSHLTGGNPVSAQRQSL